MKEKDYSFKTTIHNLFRTNVYLLKHVKGLYLLQVFSSVFIPVLGYIPSFLSKYLVDYITIGSAGSTITKLIMLVALVFLVETVFDFNNNITSYLFQISQIRFLEKFRKIIIKKVCKIPMERFEDPKYYDEISVIDKKAAGSLINVFSVLYRLLNNLVGLAVAAVLVIRYKVYIVLVYLIVLVPYLALERQTSKTDNVLFQRDTEINRRNDILMSMLKNKDTLQDIKLFQSAEFMNEEKTKRFNELYDITMKAKKKRHLLLGSRDVLQQAFKYFCYFIFAMSVLDKRITMGDFTLLIGVMERFMAESRNAAVLTGMLPEQFRFVNYYYDFLDSEEENGETLVSIPENSESLIEFRNVSFHYPGSKRQAVVNASFRIKKGEKVAIVGYNGAGKTTLVKLLVGLYKPDEGDILFCGVDTRMIANEDLYNRFSVVMQDFVKYPLTVEDNVYISDPSLSGRQSIDGVLKIAGIYSDVEKLPNKEKTWLSKEYVKGAVDLSGGQWHKLAIARSLYRSRDILIFDEPLASVDPQTEKEMIENVLGDTEGKTVIVITHQLTCISKVDRILVMEDGRIVEDGTHRDLIAKRGVYYTFFKAQAEKYSVEVS